LRSVLIVARKAKGMKVKEAAHKLGISSSFYYKIESGVRNPTMELAKSIADLYEKTVDELFFNHHLDGSSSKKASPNLIA
jgi:putative transcriptional regulator